MRFPPASRASFIPKAGVKVASKRSSAVAYLAQIHGSERCIAIGFYGKADKPAFHYSFKDAERRAKYVAEWLRSMDEQAVRKAKQIADKRAALDKPHGLKVGDVLRSSWGYDQTNIDYYQVVELIGKRSVKVREISAETVETGWLQGKCVPAVGAFIGEPMLKKVGERDDVKVRDWGVWAHKMEPIKVAGVPIGYGASSWTAYA